MKNKRSKMQVSGYLPTFKFVTTLSLLLTVYLLTDSFAQTSENTHRNQPPLEVEIADQNGSPLLIILSNVDNSAESYQSINFTIQNISSKKIKSCVIVLNDKSRSTRITTSSFESFVPQKIIQDSIEEERVNIKSVGKYYLALDFIEFEDGSTWGEDSQKQSEHISGFNEGQKTAINQVKNLLVSKDKNELTGFLKQPAKEINSPVVNDKQTEKWQRGFSSGYKFVWFRLKNAYEDKGLEAVSQKLQQMENPAKPEKK